MPHICEICGSGFKSASGLSGHRRLTHGDIAKPNTPDEHVLAEALVSTLDSLGAHEELMATLQANMSAVDNRLGSFQRSLTPPDGHNPPSLALISSWENCPSCASKWEAVKEALIERSHKEKLAEEKALAERSHEEKLAEEKALAKAANEVGLELRERSEALGKRWLIIRPGGGGRGFTWKNLNESFPGVPDSVSAKVECYCKVSEDASEVEKFRGKSGCEVIELEPVEELVD